MTNTSHNPPLGGDGSRTGTHVVVYRYGPTSVELWELNRRADVVIVAPAAMRSKYDQLGIEDEKVHYIERFDLPEMARALKELREAGPILSVTTLAEEDLIAVAYLSERFTGAIGELRRAYQFQDKLYMRLAAEGACPQPRYRPLERETASTPEELISEGFGVVKPRREMGALGVRLLTDLPHEVPVGETTDCLVEELVPHSRMLTCDGYAANGRIQRFYVHEYDAPVLESLGRLGTISLGTSEIYAQQPKLVTKLRDLCQSVLDSFDISAVRVQPFHFEFFIDNEGEPVFCEVGGRFGGMSIPRLIRYEYGVNVLEEYWNILLGGQVEVPESDAPEEPTKWARCLLKYGEPGRVVRAPSKDDFDFAESVWIYAVPGSTRSEGADRLTDNSLIVELVGRNPAELEALTDRTLAVINRTLTVEKCDPC